MMTLNSIYLLSQLIYKNNCDVGWWDNPNRCLLETLQLVSTEVAEATEGERKNLMDDHLPDRRMGEVELADALIRTLDLAAHIGMPEFDGEFKPFEVDITKSVGARHLLINSYIVVVAQELELVIGHSQGEAPMNLFMSLMDLIRVIVGVSNSFGYDIESATKEKLEYNKHRADHKRENRALVNGKKF